MKLDASILPFDEQEAIGFGGAFRNRLINRQVILTFKSNTDEYKITCGCFKVVCIPPEITGKGREDMIRRIPNILGMDILSKFKMIIEKNQVELII